MNNRKWLSPLPLHSLHVHDPSHYHTFSIQLYDHFDEINFSAYIIWMTYMLLQLDHTDSMILFPFVSFSVLFLFVFTANSSSNLSLNCLLREGLKHITLWEIAVKALCWCSKLGRLFPPLGLYRLDPMFPVSHVLLILEEYLCRQLPEKGSLGGKTLQTLHVWNCSYSTIINIVWLDSKLEIISFYDIKDIVPLSSNFHCCCWKAWSYSDPYPFSLVIYKIFFVPWFWNFIIYLGIDLFSPMILDIQCILLTRKLLFSSSQFFSIALTISFLHALCLELSGY